jgi:hypothetical protein
MFSSTRVPPKLSFFVRKEACMVATCLSTNWPWQYCRTSDVFPTQPSSGAHVHGWGEGQHAGAHVRHGACLASAGFITHTKGRRVAEHRASAHAVAAGRGHRHCTRVHGWGRTWARGEAQEARTFSEDNDFEGQFCAAWCCACHGGRTSRRSESKRERESGETETETETAGRTEWTGGRRPPLPASA